MEHSLFYIVGIALVVIALVISAIGLRSDSFPSSGVLKAGLVAVFAVVLVTGYAAIEISSSEQAEREEELDREAAAEADAETAENEEAGEDDVPEEGGTIDGAAVFVNTGCASCHTLAALPAARGEIGPNLDEALVDQDEAFIETSIVDPSAEVAEGFGDGIMPSDYGSELSPEELDALVGYLAEVTSTGSTGGGAGSGADAGSGSGSGSGGGPGQGAGPD